MKFQPCVSTGAMVCCNESPVLPLKDCDLTPAYDDDWVADRLSELTDARAGVHQLQIQLKATRGAAIRDLRAAASLLYAKAKSWEEGKVQLELDDGVVDLPLAPFVRWSR